MLRRGPWYLALRIKARRTQFWFSTLPEPGFHVLFREAFTYRAGFYGLLSSQISKDKAASSLPDRYTVGSQCLANALPILCSLHRTQDVRLAFLHKGCKRLTSCNVERCRFSRSSTLGLGKRAEPRFHPHSGHSLVNRAGLD